MLIIKLAVDHEASGRMMAQALLAWSDSLEKARDKTNQISTHLIFGETRRRCLPRDLSPRQGIQAERPHYTCRSSQVVMKIAISLFLYAIHEHASVDYAQPVFLLMS